MRYCGELDSLSKEPKRKLPGNETARIVVFILYSDKTTIVRFVLSCLAKFVLLTSASLEGLWTRFMTRSAGVFRYRIPLTN